MSVATGIPPQALLELDGETFTAVVRAEAERWPRELELMATLTELTHAHLWAYLQAHSKRTLPYEPLTIPRPSSWLEAEEEEPKTKPTPVLELAALGGHRVQRIEVEREVSEP